MFISYNKVRLHDTDMAGILYFAKQFRFAQDALEDFIEAQGLSFKYLFQQEEFIFVIVHCESDYYAPLHVGDELEVQVTIEHMGNSSFTVLYQIFKRADHSLVGQVKTVHVCLNNLSRKKVEVPSHFKATLKKFLISPKPVD